MCVGGGGGYTWRCECRCSVEMVVTSIRKGILLPSVLVTIDAQRYAPLHIPRIVSFSRVCSVA